MPWTPPGSSHSSSGADDAARRSAVARLQDVVQNMPVMLDAFDADGVIVVWNRECERVTGYSATEVIGNPDPLSLFYPDPDYRAELQREWQARGQDYLGWEWDLTCKDGTIRTIAWSSVAHRYPIPGWHTWATGVDVTNQRLAEIQLREQEALLTHAARLSVMGEMVAGIAHEINQPLHAIANFAQACITALEEASLPPDFKPLQWTRRIAGEAARAGEIIRRLGNFARRSDLEETQLDLNSIVVESMELMHFEFHRHKVHAEFHGTNSQVLVAGNRIQLQQVLVNLLRNASEALHNVASADHRVTVTLKDQSGVAELVVADNGPGLPDDAGNRIFEAFFSTKAGGLGMGLAVSRSIVEAHGGRLWAASHGGTGAEFHLSLPTLTGATTHVRSADGVRH